MQHARKMNNKDVTQEWRYKGPMQTTLKIGEQVELTEENKQQSHQLNEEKSVTPTSRTEEQVDKSRGKAVASLEFNLQNFPILCSVPTKNDFGVLHGVHSEDQVPPLDREGGGSKTL